MIVCMLMCTLVSGGMDGCMYLICTLLQMYLVVWMVACMLICTLVSGGMDCCMYVNMYIGIWWYGRLYISVFSRYGLVLIL